MILIGQYDSPFVRRVAIAMRLYGLHFEHRRGRPLGCRQEQRRYLVRPVLQYIANLEHFVKTLGRRAARE
jgi:hypothetical protein